MYHGQFTRLKESATNILVADATAQLQGSGGVHDLQRGQGDQDSIRQVVIKLWQISNHMCQPGFYELEKRIYFKMMINMY